MLIKLKKLVVKSTGYKRTVNIEEIFINSSSIMSVSNYSGVKDFLLQEGSEFSQQDFSLVKVTDGRHSESIIALGSAEQISLQCTGDVSNPTNTRVLLSD